MANKRVKRSRGERLSLSIPIADPETELGPFKAKDELQNGSLGVD